MSSSTFTSMFPLMDLPYLARARVLMFLEMDELIHLADGPSFFRLLRIRAIGYQLKIDSQCNWSIETTNHKYRLNDVPGTGLDTMDSFMARLEHDLWVLPGPIDTLQVCPTMVERLMAYKDKLPTKCTVLAFNSEVDSKNREFDRQDPTHYSWFWEPETMEVLEERRIFRETEQVFMDQLIDTVDCIGLVFDGPGRPKSDLKKVLEVDYLKVDYSDWITSNQLSRLQNKVIYLSRNNMSNGDMNQFLMDFKSGETNKNLQILTVQGYDYDDYWNRDEVMKGLDATRWNPAERDGVFHISKLPSKSLADWFYPTSLYALKRGVNLEGAFDFLKSDGTRCSVLFQDHEMVMYVWEKRENEEESRKRSIEESDWSEAKRARNFGTM